MAALTQNWITKSDLIIAFGERDLPIDDQGNVSDTKIDEAIDYAAMYVESYLRSVGIELPASASIQAELKDCMLNITRYKYSNNEATMTEEIRNRYQECIAYLGKVLSGSIILTDTGTSAGWTTMELFRR